jgi:hypothetical protein
MHQRQVVHADVAHGAAIQVRLARDRHQRGVSAIAGAVHAHALAIGDALLDRPARGIGEVVLHLAAPLARAQVLELATAAARAAIVHLQDRVTARREKLRFVIEAPAIENTVRAAVYKHDRR